MRPLNSGLLPFQLITEAGILKPFLYSGFSYDWGFLTLLCFCPLHIATPLSTCGRDGLPKSDEPVSPPASSILIL